MSHQKIIVRVRDFLITEMLSSVIRKHAESQIASIKETTAEKKKISKAEVDLYIEQHYSDLKKMAIEDLEATAKRLTEDQCFWGIFKDIGALSLILVPPMYPLIRYLVLLFEDPHQNLTEISACCIALFLLTIPIVGYFRSLFRR